MKHFCFNTDLKKKKEFLHFSNFYHTWHCNSGTYSQVMQILFVVIKKKANHQHQFMTLRETLWREHQQVWKSALTGLLWPQPNHVFHTSDWFTRSSDHFCHWGHLSLSSNVVSLDVQQHCSWLYQNAERQTPSFRSVIQSTAKSITPANVPGKKKKCRKISCGIKHTKSWEKYSYL